MNYPDWQTEMEDNGWEPIYPYPNGDIPAFKHATVKTAKGEPISIDAETAAAHYQAGTTPPPF